MFSVNILVFLPIHSSDHHSHRFKWGNCFGEAKNPKGTKWLLNCRKPKMCRSAGDLQQTLITPDVTAVPDTAAAYWPRGMWKSGLSKSKGLRGGLGSFVALCKSLKSPVPMFMGMPIIMHSETPAETQRERGMSLLRTETSCLLV